jgi:hypothetical protein
VKNSKKAARSLRTRTSGRSASHAGRGETRLRAADCLGAAALYTSSASGKLPSCLFLSAFICVHLRPIWGFGFRVGPEEKHIWPQMNADNAEVLRSGGSSGVAGISTFMSRTPWIASAHVPTPRFSTFPARGGLRWVRCGHLRYSVKCFLNRFFENLQLVSTSTGWPGSGPSGSGCSGVHAGKWWPFSSAICMS